MPNRSDSTSDVGTKFENDVVGLFEMLGYTVDHNVEIDGQQIDLFATRYNPGSGRYAVIVECKFKGSGANASNADVQSIAGAYAVTRVRGSVDACVVVTNNGFTPSAKQVAQSARIHLSTYDQLVRELFDFTPHTVGLIEDYHQLFGKPDCSWYVSTRCHCKGGSDSEDLVEVVDRWQQSGEARPLAILGSYGTGKTSFCLHYASLLCQRPDAPIPVLLRLRDFPKKMSMKSLVRDFLEDELNAPSPRFDAFWAMYTRGQILLLLDGFDEMATRCDSTTLEENLIEIERFARAGKVILTCRPEFFVTEREFVVSLERPRSDYYTNREAEYDVVEVELWSPVQIKEYIRRRVECMHPKPSETSDFYISKIEQLPELTDMATRPVHVELLLRMLPKMIQDNTPISRANLYSKYIEHELRRETVHNKRLRIMTDDERLNLLRAVAVDQVLVGTHALNYDAARETVGRYLKLPSIEIDGVTRDFLNRSFLSRRGNTYEFAHRSLGEYLLALEAAHRIHNGNALFVLNIPRIADATISLIYELTQGIRDLWPFIKALKLERDLPADKDKAMTAADLILRFTDEYFKGTSLTQTVPPNRRGELEAAERLVRDALVQLRQALAEVARKRIEVDRDALPNVHKAWYRLVMRVRPYSELIETLST